MNVDCVNLLLVGFDDILVLGLMVGVPISFIALSQFKLSDTSYSDSFLWSNYELVWLMLPVMVFVGFGISGCWLSYELISASWLEFLLVVSAYQWYWCYEILSLGEDNSIISTQNFVKGNSLFTLVTNSGDVLHSLSILSLGLHTDCIPGKMISHDVLTPWGQSINVTCQEICGNGHSSMTLGFMI